MNSISLLDQPIPPTASVGKVYLVGAGPGDPGLLTLKGKALLEQADVVIYDALVSLPILNMISPQAERIDAGKQRGRHSVLQAETTQLLIEKAKTHAVVVRLKGSDSFFFGQGGEEMEDLVKAGISVEVVPGITARSGVLSGVDIPLTQRPYHSSVTWVTGQESVGKYRPQVNWQALAHGSETIVIYMGMPNLAHIVNELSMAGLKLETPVALVRWRTCPEQETLFGTLKTIVDRAILTGFEAPAIVVIGQVVNLHTVLDQIHAATCV
jgi:uroporphyrin-III C-methyltransferase